MSLISAGSISLDSAFKVTKTVLDICFMVYTLEPLIVALFSFRTDKFSPYILGRKVFSLPCKEIKMAKRKTYFNFLQCILLNTAALFRKSFNIRSSKEQESN